MDNYITFTLPFQMSFALPIDIDYPLVVSGTCRAQAGATVTISAQSDLIMSGDVKKSCVNGTYTARFNYTPGEGEKMVYVSQGDAQVSAAIPVVIVPLPPGSNIYWHAP